MNNDKAVGKEKNNNEKITKMRSVDSSVSAISLRSLEDDDFRNLLDSAAKPQYGSLQRKRKKSQKASEYGNGRRLSDAGESTALSAEADNLLAQFRREAERNQRNADIETGEQQRAVTAFIKEAAATSRARELLEKYTEPEAWDYSLKRSKCGNSNSISNDSNNNSNNRNGFLGIGSNLDGTSKIAAAIEQKVTAVGNDTPTNNANNNCASVGDISRATQTVDKPNSIVINVDDLNSGFENGCLNTNKIAYIDEDERADDLCSPSNMYFEQNYNTHMNGGRFKNTNYTQGNSVQEIRALNEDDVVMADRSLKSTEEREIGTTTEAVDDRARKTIETSTGGQGKHDDNSFTYSSGQLRLYGNRVGSYEMQMPRLTMTTRGTDAKSSEVSVIPSNPSSSLLTKNLVPAQFDGRESFARGLLDPIEDARLNPQQAGPDDMANHKNQPDKCAIARRRKENKKAKEAKNSYIVVESKDGYMGNLSPEEILKRIEGDSKGKTKGNQKSGGNASKDQSSAVTNASKSNSGRKKNDKKDRQTEKATKRGGGGGGGANTDNEIAALSAKMETMDIEKEKQAVAESAVESEHKPEVETNVPKAEATATLPQQVTEVEENGGAGAGAAAKTTAERTTPAEEGVDDEEQYMSADEGANSNVSDEVYHTDEQSGASGSRDFISDGANYRADDEEVIPPPVTSEEAEFIPVTARSKKRGGGVAAALSTQQQLHQPFSTPGTDRKYVYSSSTVDRGAKANIRRSEVDRPRRGSVQLPSDNSGIRGNQPPGGGGGGGVGSRGNNSPSPIDRKGFQKYSGPSRRAPLLSDYIGDTSTMGKGQGNKGNGGGKGHAGGVTQNLQQQQQPKPAASTSAMGKRTKYGTPSSLQTSRTTSPDRRSSQPSAGRYAPAAAGNRPSDLTIYPTGSQGSFAKAVLSPSHKSEKKAHSPPGSPRADSSPDAERKTLEKPILAAGTAIAASCGNGKVVRTGTNNSAVAPSTQSWADVAKKRLPGDGGSRTTLGFTRDISPELRPPVNEERSFSAASSASGRAGDAKKSEHGEQKRAVSVEAVGGDSAVKDYSFFFDPNEPTATSATAAQPESVRKNETAKAEDSESSHTNDTLKPPSGGMVLNLQGGRRIVLQEGGTTITTGSTATVVDSRQSAAIQLMQERWKAFTEEKPAVLTYKELMRRKSEAKARAAAGDAKQTEKADEKESKSSKQ